MIIVSLSSVNIRALVASIVAKTGYRIVRRDVIDARGDVANPVEAFSFAALESPVLLDVPLERLRGLCWRQPCEAVHPLVKALIEYRDKGILTYEHSFLYEFYRSCQPSSASEFLGLDESEAPGFAGVAPAAFALPWHPQSPLERLDLMRRIEHFDSKEHGVLLTINDGTNLFGPISMRKGVLEMSRLISVYESMLANGYCRSNDVDGDITGVLLVDEGGDWCVGILRGQHRVAAAAVLGMEVIPVRFVYLPVRRCDVECWPQVTRGRVTSSGALKIFDRIMLGQG